jgi:hypothetical protein
MDHPEDLNGLVRFVERRNLISARVPSHFNRSLYFLQTLTHRNGQAEVRLLRTKTGATTLIVFDTERKGLLLFELYFTF